MKKQEKSMVTIHLGEEQVDQESVENTPEICEYEIKMDETSIVRESCMTV